MSNLRRDNIFLFLSLHISNLTMATELAQIDMDPEKPKMDIDTFTKYHNLSLKNNNTNDQYTKEIVDILGGIDNILKTYITMTKETNTTSNILTEDQMNEICDLIHPKTTDSMHKIIPNVSIDPMEAEISAESIMNKEDNKTNDKTVIYYFNETDTFLHSICCNDNIAQRIISFIFNKITFLTMMAVAIPYVIATTFFEAKYNLHERTWFFIMEMIFFSLTIIWVSLMIASCNKRTFSLIIKEFSFWIKIYYAIACFVANSIYIRCLDFSWNRIVYIDIGSLVFTLVIIFFSVIEGYAVSWKSMLLIGISMSSIWSLQALRFTIWYDEGEVELEIMPGVKLGLLGYMAACYRILSIFLWQQTIGCALSRGKKCISLYVSPKIQWIKKNDEQDLKKNMSEQQRINNSDNHSERLM